MNKISLKISDSGDIHLSCICVPYIFILLAIRHFKANGLTEAEYEINDLRTGISFIETKKTLLTI